MREGLKGALRAGILSWCGGGSEGGGICGGFLPMVEMTVTGGDAGSYQDNEGSEGGVFENILAISPHKRGMKSLKSPPAMWIRYSGGCSLTFGQIPPFGSLNAGIYLSVMSQYDY